MEKETFGKFLSRNWWFLLISFGHFIRNGEDLTGGEKFIAFSLTGGIIIFLMFIYWSYQNKKNN
ncbi:MAG: hypothetical protein WC870_01745 [Candidatus Paceibacterota bacterium]